MNISGVEFKSMPSGLHNVDEDLVYFQLFVFLLRLVTLSCLLMQDSAHTTDEMSQTANEMPEW
jgi:DENN domain-containing protein 11